MPNKEIDEDILSLINQADKIIFKDDVKSICDQLDSLLFIVGKSQIKNGENEVFESKIRSGILRLKKLSALDEASFYETEIIRISQKNRLKKNMELYIFLFSIMGLVVIACWGNRIIYESLS